MMTRVPELGELAEDFIDMRAEMKVLAAKIDNAPYVRADTHQAQLEAIRQGVGHVEKQVTDVKDSVKSVDASVARLQQLVVGAFLTLIVAGITAFATGATP